MAKFVGIKNGSVHLVSDTEFKHEEMTVIKLPEDLSNVPPMDLFTDYRVRGNELIHKSSHSDAKKFRIALVGNWKMACGISTYAENLWPEIAERCGHVRLFIEYNDQPTSDLRKLGSQTLDGSDVVQCWKRGTAPIDLVRELKTYEPDIIWIQHEFGLWPNASHWLSMMSQLSEYRVIVTMHSVFYHRDKTICEAAMPEIVVHLAGAKRVLEQEKKVPGKVYVIPHGCYPWAGNEKLWNMYKTTHTFMQFGFGFDYKGFSNSIRAVGILKEKYMDVFFTALISESEKNKVGHQIYYNELMKLVTKLDLHENVSLIRGYQSETTLDSYLRTNTAALFPYVSHPEHEVWGASGAARFAMSRPIPVITSNVNHFSDLPTIKASNPEDMAHELDILFSNKQAVLSQIGKQMDFVDANGWDRVADQYLNLFENVT